MSTKNEKIKEEVEKNLLDAMRKIDIAIFNIVQNLDENNYGEEVEFLSECKREIKSILNKHFDRCARSKAKYPNYVSVST